MNMSPPSEFKAQNDFGSIIVPVCNYFISHQKGESP